jgi:hypothetical protein
MTRTLRTLVATVGVLAIVALTISLRPSGSTDTADQAFTDRLDGQAVAAQQAARVEAVEAAYGQRLAAMADAYFEDVAQREQAEQAWSDRLNGLAVETGVRAGIGPRVAAAWTARLNGLAELAADK